MSRFLCLAGVYIRDNYYTNLTGAKFCVSNDNGEEKKSKFEWATF